VVTAGSLYGGKMARHEVGLTPATGKRIKFTLEQAMKTERWNRV
jgi:hypothetical protein